MSATTAKTIRENLKTIGLNRTAVSVRSPHWGSVDVEIKDRAVDFRKVNEIAMAEQRISRCEASGEILSGGNTFVHVSIVADVSDLVAIIDAATPALGDESGHDVDLGRFGSLTIFRADQWRLKAYHSEEGSNVGTWFGGGGSAESMVKALLERFGPTVATVMLLRRHVAVSHDAAPVAVLDVAALTAAAHEASQATTAAEAAFTAALAAVEVARAAHVAAMEAEAGALRACIAARRVAA